MLTSVPKAHVEATCDKIPAEMLEGRGGPAFTFAPTLASSELDGLICREGLGDGGSADKSSLVQVVCLVIYQHFSRLLSQVSLLYGTQRLAGG